MQFTPQELKMIAKLREQERRWPRRRWILIGMAALLVTAYECIARYLLSTVESQTFSPAESAMLVAFCWPMVLPMALMAGALLALVIRDWRGNVQRMLLLKLLASQQGKQASDEKVD